MYNFIDVNEVSEGKLPSEALKINGNYIENQIVGYRTLHVSGREALSPEIETYETGVRDGSTIQSKRYPARTIIVTYQLIAETNEKFREAYNQLAAILDVKDAQLIFNDEQDKFYTGTPSAIGEVEPGRNSVIGEFEIYCADPFKYSVVVYEVDATDNNGKQFVCNYNGTYKAYPTLEASFYSEEETDGETNTELTGNGDCGYVAFFNDREKIIQLGEPEEEDGESLEKSQTLVNQSFRKSTSWGTATKSLWVINNGVTSSDAFVQTGTVGVVKSYHGATNDECYLVASNYGTGTQWHGPSITRTIPADASGHIGAKNFTLTYMQKLSIGSGKDDIKQKGAFQVMLVSGSGSTRKIVAGACIFKNTDGKAGKLRFYLNGKVAYTMNLDLSYYNKYFGNNSVSKGITTVKTSSITKSGQTVTFNLGGIKKVFRDSAIADVETTQVVFSFDQCASSKPFAWNGLYWVKFVKNNCDTWKDVPNKFSASDVALADCKNGEVYVNDMRAPEMGALGNDWEEFYLERGVNQIGISYSDWVQDAYAPTFKMRYREVFL